VRDASRPGAPAVPFDRTNHVFLHKAEPYLAITDEDYYVAAVEEMARRQVAWRGEEALRNPLP
jgi:hypothetical protein